jgi:hypothetical protein
MLQLYNCSGIFCLRDIFSIQVASPSWESGSTATINFFFQYRPKNTVQEIYDENFQHILEAGTDVVFFNFGVHWPPAGTAAYKLKMGKVLETIQQHGLTIPLLVAFRETSAQHFNTTGGEWPEKKTTKHRYLCSSTGRRQLGWMAGSYL